MCSFLLDSQSTNESPIINTLPLSINAMKQDWGELAKPLLLTERPPQSNPAPSTLRSRWGAQRKDARSWYWGCEPFHRAALPLGLAPVHPVGMCCLLATARRMDGPGWPLARRQQDTQPPCQGALPVCQPQLLETTCWKPPLLYREKWFAGLGWCAWPVHGIGRAWLWLERWSSEDDTMSFMAQLAAPTSPEMESLTWAFLHLRAWANTQERIVCTCWTRTFINVIYTIKNIH